MRRYDIWAFVKDPAGTHNVLAVLDALAQVAPEISVLLIAEGKALELCADRKPLPASMDLLKDGAPRVLLTSMCSGESTGRKIIPFVRQQGTMVVAVQDFWGARLKNEWSNLMYRPDRITVPDTVARDIVLEFWKGFDASRIKITGFPVLDQYAHILPEPEAVSVLHALGLHSGSRLLLFAGQGKGSAATLRELLTALDEVTHDFIVVPLMHPRAEEDFPDEMCQWQEVLASTWRSPVFYRRSQGLPIRGLLCACAVNSGVVVSMYSTTLIHAAALRAPAISMLFPLGMEAYREETGLEEFPLVTGGSAVPANDSETLRQRLQDAAKGLLNIRRAQEQQFPRDGKNAARAAQVVMDFLRCN